MSGQTLKEILLPVGLQRPPEASPPSWLLRGSPGRMAGGRQVLGSCRGSSWRIGGRRLRLHDDVRARWLLAPGQTGCAPIAGTIAAARRSLYLGETRRHVRGRARVALSGGVPRSRCVTGGVRSSGARGVDGAAWTKDATSGSGRLEPEGGSRPCGGRGRGPRGGGAHRSSMASAGSPLQSRGSMKLYDAPRPGRTTSSPPASGGVATGRRTSRSRSIRSRGITSPSA